MKVWVLRERKRSLRRAIYFAVRRKVGGGKTLSIDDLTIESGAWQYSRRLHEDLAAKSWGIDLESWYKMPQDIRAEHIAVYELEAQMHAYDNQVAEREMKSRRK